MLNFLEACRAGDFHRAAHYLDLRDRKPEDRLKDGPVLAQQLMQILDRDTQFDLADLSNDALGDMQDGLPNGTDELDRFNVNGSKIDLQLTRIDTRSGLHIWLVSADSVKKIPALNVLLTESPVEKFLPSWLVTNTLLDTALWQWILYALVIGALIVASRMLSQLVLTILGLIFRRFSSSLDAHSVHRLLKPLRWLVSVSVFRATVEFIGASALLRLYLTRGTTFLLFIGIAWLIGAVLDGITDRIGRQLALSHRGISHSVLPLVQRVLKISIFIFAILATLAAWGYNTNTLLAGLGVGGLAVALAAQKTLENLFGGISVITDRPVLVGDVCRFGTQVGVVEEIGLRSTRIRTGERSLLSVPNAQFSTLVLENLSARDRFLFSKTLNLRGDASGAAIRAVMDGIAQLLSTHEKVDAGNLPVRFTAFGEYSMRLEIFAYVRTSVEDEYLKIQSDLLVSILNVVEAAGTALAVPMRETWYKPMVPLAVPDTQEAGNLSARPDGTS